MDLIEDWEGRLVAMRARKDAAYLERNQVVAALAGAAIQLGGRAWLARTAIPGWDPSWHGCVYIELPGDSGQVSWHFHDSHAHLFAGLPTGTIPWDGHDTDEKYRRLDRFARLARGAA